MSATFDFQALATRAPIDQPDAALHADIEALTDLYARRSALRIDRDGVAGFEQRLAIVQALAKRKPATLEGLLAKIRFAEARMHKAPIFELEAAALRDVIEWLDPPQPRRRAKKGSRT